VDAELGLKLDDNELKLPLSFNLEELFKNSDKKVWEDFALPPQYFIVSGAKGPYVYGEDPGNYKFSGDPGTGKQVQLNHPVNGKFRWVRAYAVGNQVYHDYENRRMELKGE
jgi:hypothetical protein